MIETLEDVTKKRPEPTAEEKIAEELVRRAREEGVALTGPGGNVRNGTRAKTVLTEASG